MASGKRNSNENVREFVKSVEENTYLFSKGKGASYGSCIKGIEHITALESEDVEPAPTDLKKEIQDAKKKEIEVSIVANRANLVKEFKFDSLQEKRRDLGYPKTPLIKRNELLNLSNLTEHWTLMLAKIIAANFHIRCAEYYFSHSELPRDEITDPLNNLSEALILCLSIFNHQIKNAELTQNMKDRRYTELRQVVQNINQIAPAILKERTGEDLSDMPAQVNQLKNCLAILNGQEHESVGSGKKGDSRPTIQQIEGATLVRNSAKDHNAKLLLIEPLVYQQTQVSAQNVNQVRSFSGGPLGSSSVSSTPAERQPEVDSVSLSSS